MRRAALYLTFSSAVAILFGIAVSQILLALALAALLLSGEKLRLPPIWMPLGLFLLWTLVSLAFSPDPAAGLPQVRKVYVYSMLLVAFSALRDFVVIRRLFLAWAVGGALVAARGFAQYIGKVEEARARGLSFYEFYTAERITGFMSHWMTFGGQLMFAVLMLASFVFFAPPEARRKWTWIWIACGAAMGAALLLGQTRSIWGASGVAGIYLLWNWRRWVALATPVVLAAGLLVAPADIRTRVKSAFQPRNEIDSNEHRYICRRIGYEMILAHPVVGVGPEEVPRTYQDYTPPDLPKPLPTGWYGHLHNIYIQYAAERGIPALLALMWLLVKMLVDFVRALRRLPPGPSDRRFILHGALAVVIATMVAGFWEHNLGDSEVLTMFLIVAACGYVAAETEGEAAVAEAGVVNA